MSKLDLTDPATIERLTAALQKAGVYGIEIAGHHQSLRIHLAGPAGELVAQRRETKPAPADISLLKAPLAGEFWQSDVSRATLGGAGTHGDVAGFVRIGPVLVPVKAGISRKVHRYIAETGTLVHFGDAIAEVEPET